MPMARNWHGITLEQKINRAAGRAIVGIGLAVAVETKNVTHVVSGTLKRSVHCAGIEYNGDDDEMIAGGTKGEEGGGQDMLLFDVQPTPTWMGPVVQVGSWLPYACVEWIGRAHPGITQGMEIVRGARADRIVLQAFREEGL